VGREVRDERSQDGERLKGIEMKAFVYNLMLCMSGAQDIFAAIG
jgi:hypothetical protein